jgi:hypothetical protein
MEDDNYASSLEIFIVGVIGVALYCFVLSVSVVNLFKTTKAISKYFFIAMSCLALLEMPRFIAMIIEREYASVFAYSFHVLATYLNFLCVSLVCLMWSWLLELGQYTNIIYSRNGRIVIITNFVFAVSCITACTFALMSSSLDDFFNSDMYFTFVCVEAVYVVFYAGVIAIFGVRLQGGPLNTNRL